MRRFTIFGLILMYISISFDLLSSESTRPSRGYCPIWCESRREETNPHSQRYSGTSVRNLRQPFGRVMLGGRFACGKPEAHQRADHGDWDGSGRHASLSQL